MGHGQEVLEGVVGFRRTNEVCRDGGQVPNVHGRPRVELADASMPRVGRQ